VDLESGIQRDHLVYKIDPDLKLPTDNQTSNLFLGGLSTAWEVDLWGRIRRSNEAANAEYLATEEGRRGLMLALITEVAQQQKREVAALADSVSIARRRYLGGLASYYEVLEAQQLLYPAEISLSETSRDRRLAIVQLYRALGGGWNFSNTQLTNGQ
jgi:outer membrane protein TolC